MLTKFLIFDGVDEVGKSTFIKNLKTHPQASPYVVELNFPKILPLSGDLLRINDEKSFELLFAAFEYLDPRYTYVLDRFITSNLVYDKVLRGEATLISKHYWQEFTERFNVKECIFTRPAIEQDFVDDKISMSKDKFNECIQEYHEYGENHMLLVRDESGKVIGVNKDLEQLLIADIIDFIHAK